MPSGMATLEVPNRRGKDGSFVRNPTSLADGLTKRGGAVLE